MSEAPGRCMVKGCESLSTTDMMARVEAPYSGNEPGSKKAGWVFDVPLRVCSVHWQDWPTRVLELRLQR